MSPRRDHEAPALTSAPAKWREFHDARYALQVSLEDAGAATVARTDAAPDTEGGGTMIDLSMCFLGDATGADLSV